MSDFQAALQDRFNVSRETMDRLRLYVTLLEKWNPAINLVARNSMAQVWERHFLDSAQLAALVPPTTKVLVDLGSGAGFPGLVLAIMGEWETHLIESDVRKAAFLREVARATESASVQVHAIRIESAPTVLGQTRADVISARALTGLADLLDLATPLLKPDGVCLFPKGKSVDIELTAAAESWKMRTERFPSQTDPLGTILRLSEIAPLASNTASEKHHVC